MNDDRIIKTYVWHKDQCFFVSTIERDSSAMESMTYNETIVWEYNYERRERGEMIFHDDDSKGSIDTHQRIVESLYSTGLLPVRQSSW
jgi:hypothetical protein